MNEVLIQTFAATLLGAGGLLAAAGSLRPRSATDRAASALILAGWLALIGLVAWLWAHLGRPPLRTLGETRLLYAAWLPAIALFAAWRWRTRLLLAPMAGMALLFLLLNLMRPEARVKALMPALQSGWFVPHVVVYMAAYACLGLASLAAAVLLLRRARGIQDEESALALPLRLLWLGFPLLTAGLVVGAFWAKTAWGDYWTWDPKETWAFLSWAFYLVPLHQRLRAGSRAALWLPLLGFPIVLLCWFGVNLLPTAAQSLHSYSE